jgi:hypothetical protein
MAKKVWFKKRPSSILFVPLNWKGWLAVFVMFALIIISAYLNNFLGTASVEQRVRLLFEVVLILVVSIVFFDSKAK